jgi:hypothetical protein
MEERLGDPLEFRVFDLEGGNSKDEIDCNFNNLTSGIQSAGRSIDLTRRR